MSLLNVTYFGTGMDQIKKTADICLVFPPKVVSPGLPALFLGKYRHRTLLDYSAPRLQLQVVVIFVLTQIIHSLLKNLGLPLFISQILAGIILGPTFFGNQFSLVNVSEDSVSVLGSVGGLGILFFLFLSGVKMDVSSTFNSGMKAMYIGILTVLVPLASCLITITILLGGGSHLITNRSFYLATTYAGTSFPVIHYLLSELRILNSELGRLGLSAALIGDMVTLVLTLFGTWMRIGIEKGTNQVLVDIGWAMLFIVIAVFVLRPGLNWMVKHTPETGHIKDVCFYVVVLAFMMSPGLADLVSLQAKYGPIILGLAVPDGPPLGSALVEKLDPITSDLFLPVFVATCGMRFNISNIKEPTKLAKDHAIAGAVALVIKFWVTLVLAMICKMHMRDSLAFSLIMISKGVVEIASYSIMSDHNMISDDLFCYLTIMVILMSSIVPILVKWLYDPSRKYLCFQKRTIMNTKLNQELRMIGCIHVPGNVNSIISLLHACCPTRDSSISLDALHLVKLSGRATPVFIAHDKPTKTMSNRSYSENVIIAFNQFQRNTREAVSVKVFTAVSPPNLMYEDICKLAVDRLTSFIILPFHRRWCIDGSIESEDQTIRNLNFDILEMAPCSVGILVDVRRNPKSLNVTDKSSASSHHSSSYNIAVIFMGGRDDREALALAKRISQDQSVSLTVIHLKAKNSLEETIRGENDRMLDDEMLSGIKESVKLTYIEEQVTDGPETSNFLRSIVEDYQLIIVGRRHKCEDPQTLGLGEWCEFQEIGIIGDLLSSSDFVGNYFLLIVQQQQQRSA
ncbi:cation/H(+) antiporter 4-like [Hibiscus syriacus]|uniref:cation/H(+) antiporter 4-like n=1 Tax=Hibiscus syriacus TaxID=106335 RepID=UPI001922F1D3|nr:cation/H(+) antiporter 4-like [Hibiscus syriacus]